MSCWLSCSEAVDVSVSSTGITSVPVGEAVWEDAAAEQSR